MAQARGVTCDVCSKFTTLTGKDMTGQPAGWMRLLLPRTDQDQEAEYRDICSGRCLEKMGKARREVDGDTPRTARPRTTPLEPGLAAAFDAAGLEGRVRGAALGRHAQARCGSDCVVCAYERSNPGAAA